MIASELMFKVWDGDENEFFTHTDMNRIEYNANIVAADCGVPTITFTEVTRASQFDYSEAQKLETLIQDCGDAAGVFVDMERYWGSLRSVSYIDFERWESSLFSIYQSRGGLGSRIEAGTVLPTYSFTLFPSSWTGSGPYHIDLDAPALHDGAEALAYVPHYATIEQRTAEANAVLQLETISERRIRITAMGMRPHVAIPVRISLDGLDMYKGATLSASSWSGSGPYTQTVTLDSEPANAVVGQSDGMTEAQVLACMQAMMSVSAISGKTITIRALGDKPTVDIPVGILYEAST